MFFDTHAHLESDQLAPQLSDVLARARAAGVAEIVAVGTTRETSERCAELAATQDGVYSSAGIHPNHCLEAVPGDWERIVALFDLPRVVAVGETGLDRYWKDVPFDLQQESFARHLTLAQERDLPVIIHMRECGDDILASLRQAVAHGPLKGIMHAFSGDQRLAAECLALGLHISFAGMVTYKKSDDLRTVAKEVPADRLLIETDSPYLSPHPLRSQRPNEPALVMHTAACLAEVRGVPLAELAAQTTANARRLFGV